MEKGINREIRRRELPAGDLVLGDDVPELLTRVYRLRGIRDRNEISSSMDQLLPPTGLLHIERAAQLVIHCIIQQRTIVVVGDYDADGATSTAVLLRFMRQIGFGQIHYFVPNRFEYGYGLTAQIVEVVKSYQPEMIITVDNGISSLQGVDYANQCGIKVLVTDHHLPGQKLPAAEVILNPNQPEDQFASKALAGVGVLFYLLLEVRRQLLGIGWFEQQGIEPVNMAQYLDLVALGTVADVVPLDRNNRLLVEQGLRRIRANQCCAGIRALLELGQRRLANVVASDLGFVVGPRINAAGRLEDISIGIECLLTDDRARAMELAGTLDQLNVERKEIEQEMVTQANAYVQRVADRFADRELPLGLSVFQRDWHQGVTGIVASRLKERYHRPTIVFASTDEGELKGSARSIPGIHIRDVLEHVAAISPGLIIKFGGHAMAAGLSIPADALDEFNAQFNDSLSHWMSPELLQPVVYSDGELKEDEYSLDTATLLQAAGPWGQGFPEPLFDGEFEVLRFRVVGMHHLKLELRVRHGSACISGIVFHYQKAGWQEPCRYIRAAFHLDVNEYQGIRASQLNIKYIEPITA